MAKPMLLIIANQRSGTTALRNALAKTNLFFDCKEIFHTELEENSFSFLNYSLQNNLTAFDIAVPRKNIQLFNDYLNYLKKCAGNKIPLVDIKYNSLRALDGFWGYRNDAPLVLNEVIKNELPLIWIKRRKKIDLVLSENLARATNKWHDLVVQNSENPRELGLKEVETQLISIKQTEKYLEKRLSKYLYKLEVYYEDLFINNQLSVEIVSWINQIKQTNIQEKIATSHKKTVVNYENVFSNYQELVLLEKKIFSN